MRFSAFIGFVLGFIIAANSASASITYPPKQVQDEGSALAFEPYINFVGAGVTCTDDSANLRTTCTFDAGTGGTASPLTTKGDLYTYSTVDTRLAVGTDGLCLKSNSATATGLEWNTCSATSAYSVVQDEGSSLTSRGTINFIGAAITCVDNSGASRTDCTIDAGTGGGGGGASSATGTVSFSTGAFDATATITAAWATSSSVIVCSALGEEASVQGLLVHVTSRSSGSFAVRAEPRNGYASGTFTIHCLGI